MRQLETSQTIKKHKILRNGKILIPSKKKSKKKYMIINKGENQLSHKNCTIANIKGYDNTDDTDIYDKLLSKYDHILNGRKLFIVLTKLPLSISQTQLLHNHPMINNNNTTTTTTNNNNHKNNNNNNNNYRNGYRKLENFISSNEIQIYDNFGIKIAENQELHIQTPTIVNNNNSIKRVKQKDEQAVERITRAKIIKQKSEERKQLDKIMFDKFPSNTFKKFAVHLDDISKEVKFLSSLGLTFRCKCPLTYNKIRRI